MKKDCVQINIVKIRTRKLERHEGFRKCRIYIFTDESILENLLLRASGENCHPSGVYRKQVLPAIWKSLNITPPKKINWSSKAGCSCGCSPGFIINDKIHPLHSKEVFVDIKINPIC